MTRIIAGQFRGRQLAVPKSGVRPTSGRVREAMFSWLEHRDALIDARVLDLFAGSGALGLEAVSRGAESLTAVDSSRAAIQVIERNVRTLGLADLVSVVFSDAVGYTANLGSTTAFDLVFLDPPYDLPGERVAQVLANLAASGAVSSEAVVVVEQSMRIREPLWPPGQANMIKKTYGDTAVYYCEPSGLSEKIKVN